MNEKRTDSDSSGGIVPLDPQVVPLSQHLRVYDGEIRDAAAKMVRSVSGWRTVFAPGDDPESMSPSVPPVQRYLAAAMAVAFTRFRQDTNASGTVVLACDARPTGPVLADVMLRVFTARRVPVVFAGITSSPQAVALTLGERSCDGMCYITASHNPPGYNGVKWGDGDGKVLGAADAVEVSRLLDSVLKPPELAEGLRRLVDYADRSELRRIIDGQEEAISRSAQFYRSSIISRATRGTEWQRVVGLMNDSVVVADFNGSARTTGIDASLLSELNCSLVTMHATPGSIHHAIEPEGAALDDCSAKVTELVASGEPVALGYVPDNDGDRGNLVFPAGDQARILGGQDVFCLAVIAELSWLKALDITSTSPLAIVVNGPTSLRIDQIARAFGAQVFRAEVGEANVVAKAEELRADGWFVPIFGEGSNGGNITAPATIRDPISTIVSMLRLVSMSEQKVRSQSGQALLPGGHPLLCALRALNSESPMPEESIPRTPADCFEALRVSLPEFSTTPVTSKRARINVGAIAHETLKQRVEALLPDRAPEAIGLLERQDETGSTWEIMNFEGTHCRPGTGNRDPQGDGTGGFTVWFYGAQGSPFAFVWMRGSRTEPVFRVIADVTGSDDTREVALLEWFKSVITECIY